MLLNQRDLLQMLPGYPYHVNCPRQTSLEDVGRALTSALEGFVPLIGSLASKLSRLEAAHKVNLRDLVPSAGVEVFAREDARAFVVLLALEQEDRRARPSFEIRIFAEDMDTRDRILESVASLELLSAGLQRGTFKEGMAAASLRERLQGEGPMARKLRDPEIGKACDLLCDDALRSVFGNLLATFGPNPVPEKWWATRLGREVDASLLERLTASALVRRRYIIECSACGQTALVFETRDAAKTTLEKADRKCRFCGEGELDVVDGIECAPAAQEARAGLWLEKLVFETVRSFSVEALHGRMLESSELDVTAIVGDETLLFECKDRSFGQNDYYVLAMKAQELGADTAIIVTTSPVHENVREAIRRQNESQRSRKIELVEADTTGKIVAKIEELARRLSENYNQLATGVSSRIHTLTQQFNFSWPFER